MHKLIIILAGVIGWFALARASESISYTVNVDYSTAVIDTASHSSGEIFQKISISGLYNTADLNDPTIPVRYITYEVPIFVNNLRTTVSSATLQNTISIEKPLLPFEIYSSDEKQMEKNNAVIYGNGYYAEATSPMASIEDEYFVNGNRHFVVVKVTPLIYHHAALTVDCYNQINVQLEFDPCNASELKFRPLSTRGFQAVHSIPESAIDVRSSKLPAMQSQTASDEDVLKKYVFITPAELVNSLERLAEWKRQKGYDVRIQTVEDILSTDKYRIGANARCFDKESSVREWLRDYYEDNDNDNGAFYCLIVGDYHTSAPIRKFKFPSQIHSEITPIWTDSTIDEYVPTDVYFADLVSDWNFIMSEADIYVSDITSASLSPTIPVGRLLCWTNEQIQNFTDKVILYELYPGKGDASYLTKGFVVKHQDFFKKYGIDYPTIFAYTDAFDVTTLKSNYADIHYDLRPLSNEVIDAMKKSGIYSLQGHGGTTGITFATVSDPDEKWPQDRSILALEEYKNLSTATKWDNGGGLDLLDNANAPAIAYSWACSIAPYDNRFSDPSVIYNVCSSFTVAGKYGGPAFLANTRPGFFGTSNYLEDNFARHIEDFRSIGQIENTSKIEYTSSGAYAKFVKFTHNIIGDSELRIWRYNPVSLTGRIMLRSGSITFNGPSGNYIYGVKNLSSGNRTVVQGDNSFSTGIFDGNSQNKIASLYVESDKYLPQTFLITSGEPIDLDAGAFLFREIKFAKPSSSVSKIFNISDYTTSLNMGENGKIRIFAFNSINSDQGINIGNEGTVELECEKEVILKGDIIESGGTMKVKSGTLVLDKGFEVKKGGTLTMSLNK